MNPGMNFFYDSLQMHFHTVRIFRVIGLMLIFNIRVFGRKYAPLGFLFVLLNIVVSLFSDGHISLFLSLELNAWVPFFSHV